MDVLNFKRTHGLAVSKCQFIPEGMKCFNTEPHSKLFLVVWKSVNVIIFRFNCLKSTSSFEKLGLVDKEELTLRFPIVDIFVVNEIIYGADVTGKIYEFNYQSFKKSGDINRLSNDCDMFELSPESHHEWNITELGAFNNCDILLAVSSCNDKIIAVTSQAGKLFGHVYKLNSFHQLSIVTLADASSDKVVMCNINTNLCNELKMQYFSFLENNEVEISIIGLSTGQAVSFSISDQSDEAHVVFSSMQPIVNINYLTDKSKQKCTAILVLVASGTLTVLDGKSSLMLHISGPIICSLFCLDLFALITSDGVDCSVSKIHNDNSIEESNLRCKLKGVRTVCSVPEITGLVLAATQHNYIYWWNLNAVERGDADQFVMPEDEVLNELFSTAKLLNEAHFKMKKEDAIMRAVSLATRAKFLENYFTTLVKFFSGKNNAEDKLKLRIENSCDFASFTPDLWSLSLTISYGGSSIISMLHKLDKPFCKDFPLLVECKCSPIIESELTCKLISRFGDKQPLLIVPLGKVVIDAGYFLTVLKDKSKLLEFMRKPLFNLKTSSVCNETNVIPSSIKSVNDGNVSDKKIVVYTMKLDTSVPADKILQTIFRDSSHRMSKNQWLGMSDSNFNEICALIGQKYWVEISVDKKSLLLNIRSNDIYSCYLIKRAISCRLQCDNPVQLDSDIFIEAEGIKFRFEMARLRMDWNLKEFTDIKSEFRSQIINKISLHRR